MTSDDDLDLGAERIARAFHTTYERLAPQYSYETRPESAVPWQQVPRKNRMLMIATARRLLEQGVIQLPRRCSFQTIYGRCARNENHHGLAHLAPPIEERGTR